VSLAAIRRVYYSEGAPAALRMLCGLGCRNFRDACDALGAILRMGGEPID